MHPFPHHYVIRASGGPAGDVALASAGLPSLASAPPAEFDGPGDRWSPETMLVAAAADCLILTFRSIARASALEFEDLVVSSEGEVGKIDGRTRFTRIVHRARLTLPEGADADRAKRLLEKAERACLVSASLAAAIDLHVDIAGATGRGSGEESPRS